MPHHQHVDYNRKYSAQETIQVSVCFHIKSSRFILSHLFRYKCLMCVGVCVCMKELVLASWRVNAHLAWLCVIFYFPLPGWEKLKNTKKQEQLVMKMWAVPSWTAKTVAAIIQYLSLLWDTTLDSLPVPKKKKNKKKKYYNNNNKHATFFSHSEPFVINANWQVSF